MPTTEPEASVPLVKKLVRKRAALKAKVTNQFALLNEDSSPDSFSICEEIVLELLSEIKAYDSQICEILSEECSDEDIPDSVSTELSNQSSYLTKARKQLLSYKTPSSPPPSPAPSLSVTDCKLKLPELRCDTFSGEGSSQLEFHSFITMFNNVVGLRTNLSDSTKLTYLKTYLKGYASKLIQHLQVTNNNYKIALNLLNEEFLNVDALVDDLLKKLLDLKPSFDPTFLKTKMFLSEVRCLVSDLKIYGFDFLKEKGGCY